MANSYQDILTSPSALNNSIQVDGQVHHWFAYLIRQAAVEAYLSKNEKIKRLYHNLKSAQLTVKVLYILLLFFLLVVYLSGQYKFFVLGLIALPIWVYLSIQKRKYVEGICAYLIEQDYDKFSFSQKTLYQICEFYSQKYEIFSLVDAIGFSNKASRATLIITFLVTCFIYPLNFWYVCLSMVSAFFLIRIVIKTDLVYKRIK